jgi:hypothetical protein
MSDPKILRPLAGSGYVNSSLNLLDARAYNLVPPAFTRTNLNGYAGTESLEDGFCEWRGLSSNRTWWARSRRRTPSCSRRLPWGSSISESGQAWLIAANKSRIRNRSLCLVNRVHSFFIHPATMHVEFRESSFDLTKIRRRYPSANRAQGMIRISRSRVS